jgi:uncharacterized protein YjbI with pentapeptide repeats
MKKQLMLGLLVLNGVCALKAGASNTQIVNAWNIQTEAQKGHAEVAAKNVQKAKDAKIAKAKADAARNASYAIKAADDYQLVLDRNSPVYKNVDSNQIPWSRSWKNWLIPRHGVGLAGIVKAAFLEGKVFSGKDLSGANLVGAKLQNAKMVGTKLINANLNRADLRKVDFTNADLTGAIMPIQPGYTEKTIFTGATMPNSEKYDPKKKSDYLWIWHSKGATTKIKIHGQITPLKGERAKAEEEARKKPIGDLLPNR